MSLVVDGDEDSFLWVSWPLVSGQPVAYDWRVSVCESLALSHVDEVGCRAATDELSAGWCSTRCWFVLHRVVAGDCRPA